MKNMALILDEKANGLAKDYLRTEGELLSLLMEMRRKRVFAELNYSGIFDYCERALNLSRAQAFYFKTVAEKSEEVPEIKLAIAQGELTLSQARRIVSVVTKQNHNLWIEKAKSLPQKELEREVTAVNPKARVQEKIRPLASEISELKVAVDSKTEENLVALKEILSQKLGKPATLGQVIVWAVETTRERFDPVRRAERARRVSMGVGGSPKEGDSIRGSVSSGNDSLPKSGRQPIQSAIKHSVSRRDGMQCTYVSQDGRRCQQRRWLHLHHKIEVKSGGLNTVENLHTLCCAHHRLVHTGAARNDDYLVHRV